MFVWACISILLCLPQGLPHYHTLREVLISTSWVQCFCLQSTQKRTQHFDLIKAKLFQCPCCLVRSPFYFSGHSSVIAVKFFFPAWMHSESYLFYVQMLLDTTPFPVIWNKTQYFILCFLPSYVIQCNTEQNLTWLESSPEKLAFFLHCSRRHYEDPFTS